MSSGIPNSEQARGINNNEPPATPEAPQADNVATKLNSRAVGMSIGIPKVAAVAIVITVIVIAAPSIFIVAPRGIETHYYTDNSLDLGACVNKALVKKIPYTTNRGLLRSRFYVINHTIAPAILVEIGFISNPDERKSLISSQRKQQTAEGIADGIIEYFNSTKK